jgi:RNA polymerase sigma-70 factor (ECF subfamily)
MTVPEFHSPSPSADLRRVDAVPSSSPAREDAKGEPATRRSRLRVIIDRHYDFVWRTLRYLGVPEASAEDAAQEVLCVLARRLDEVVPAAEVSFLFSTARRVASTARRAARRQPAFADQDVDALVAPLPNPEELLDGRRAQEVLHEVLDALPVDLRLVFVLFEIEELTLGEVAALLGIPAGTVASRLRRARESFRGTVRRMRAAHDEAVHGGGQ